MKKEQIMTMQLMVKGPLQNPEKLIATDFHRILYSCQNIFFSHSVRFESK